MHEKPDVDKQAEKKSDYFWMLNRTINCNIYIHEYVNK